MTSEKRYINPRSNWQEIVSEHPGPNRRGPESALQAQSAASSEHGKRVQLLARRFAKVLQGIEALPAPRELPEIGDRPVGPVIRLGL